MARGFSFFGKVMHHRGAGIVAWKARIVLVVLGQDAAEGGLVDGLGVVPGAPSEALANI